MIINFNSFIIFYIIVFCINLKNMMKKIILILLIFTVSAGIIYSSPRKIVYSSNQSSNGYLQIFTMNEDGSNKKQLTFLDADCIHPRWSKDGSKIVFGTLNGKIYLLENVNKDTIIEPYFVFGGSNPCFTNDGEEIIFNSEHNGFLTIYIMEPREPDASMLVSDDYSNQQVLSEDGSKLVYSAFYNGYKSILEMDLDDSTDNNVKKISKNDNANLEPDISKSGKMITYASFNNQLHGTIYIYKDGKETALTKGFSSSNQPKFSPDEKKIGFVVISGKSVDLYIMNIDGTGKKEIIIKGGNIGTYRWIDNDRIIYDAEDGKSYKIGIVNINSQNCELIAKEGINFHPDVTGQ